MMIENQKIEKKASRIQTLILILLTLGISCQKNDTSQKTISEKSQNLTGISIQDLALTIPVTREELKKWIPDQIGEFSIIKTVIGYKESVEMSAIKATYSHQLDTSKQVVLEILDGAGPVASVLLSGSIQKLNLDFQELKPDGYSRIHERNGHRVWEVENTKEEVAELEFIHAGRFLVTLKGHHLQNEELWSLLDSLDFKTLK
ncbi:hypothetical protein [Aquiflexum sp.]|uniref:hypothetical protein n=1 Tax=Aquiflexum sp. TaxID=1872584 RepID=UPI0035940819